MGVGPANSGFPGSFDDHLASQPGYTLSVLIMKLRSTHFKSIDFANNFNEDIRFKKGDTFTKFVTSLNCLFQRLYSGPKVSSYSYGAYYNT